MRRLVPVLLLLCGIFTSLSPVGATQQVSDALDETGEPNRNSSEVDPTCGASKGGNSYLCGSSRTYEVVTQAPDGSITVARVATLPSTKSGKSYVPYNRLSTAPGGEPCAATGYVEEGTTPPDERLLRDPNPMESNIPIYSSYEAVLEDYAPCPEQPRVPGQPAPVETRAMIAARHWERITLPKPEPFIAPGRAITGKTAYLETRGETAHTYATNTIFGPLTILAKGSYTIDWGDGTTTGPYEFEGRPWPHGQITYEYLEMGRYNITVIERWTANWSYADESGRLRTLQTEGRIDNFPVEQIQAVIRR